MIEKFYLPEWGTQLRNYYYLLRNMRGQQIKRRRTIYRRISDEKKRLTESGVNAELVRLYCLYLVNPTREQRLRRFAFLSAQYELDLSRFHLT